MTQLCVQNVSKQYQTGSETLHVLRDINLTLKRSDNVSIVGPSGCGKSTLLYIIGTLAEPSGGSVTLDGTNPFELGKRQLASFRNHSVGFVFQDHHLLPQLTVMENVLLPAMAAGSISDEHQRRAAVLLENVGLSARQRHLPSELSGGERQRAAVARALLMKPKVLLADEPTGNLDQENTERIARLLFELPLSEGAILITVTHSVWVASRASRQLRLEAGSLVE